MLLIFCFIFIIRSFNDHQIKKLESSTITYSEPNQYEIILEPGRYKVTCYGAQGGMSHSGKLGGNGAKVSGYFNVTQHNQKFYAFVGGQGIRSSYGSAAGGFNGGGISGYCERYKKHWHHHQKDFGPGSGGGATDLRIDNNDINNRIIVAAGGSGASHNDNGAHGGDLNGYNAFGPSSKTNQQLGNSNGRGSDGGRARRYPSSGGGGGYRGGISGISTNSYNPYVVSDSGSSYISGYPYCDPHSKIIFDTFSMNIGIKEGDGSIQIERIYTCSENCLDCVNSNQCKNCDPSYRLFEGFCYTTCPIGTIDRISYCERCDPSCQSCSETSTNCTSCHEGYFYYKGQCLEKCPVSTFKFESQCLNFCPISTYAKEDTCEECNLSCLECIDKPSKCIECSEEKFLYNNQCIDKCPEHSVIDGNKCLAKCQSDQFLYNGTCYTGCPNGTFAQGLSCKKCDSSCEECLNDEKTCTKCNKNTYLHNSKCIDKCPENYYTYDNKCVINCPSEAFIDGKECVDICPNGTYGFNHLCKLCDSACESCENSSNLCTKCHEGSYLYNNQCISECINNTFILQNECVRECPPGFYLFNNICEEELDYDTIEIYKRVPILSKILTRVLLAIVFVFIIILSIFIVIVCIFQNKE